MRWLLVAAALFLCWDHCSAEYRPERNVEAAFSYACRVSEYECDGLAPPEIKHTALRRRGMNGMYRTGDRHIWVEKSLVRTNARYWSVVVHEFVHYIQYWSHAPFRGHICDREREAWDTANAWLQESGRRDLMDLKWYELYDCPRH